MSQLVNEISLELSEATLNNPKETDVSLLIKLSSYTHNPDYIDIIVRESCEGLVVNIKNYFQIHKTLVLINYMIINGNEELAERYNEHVGLLFNLKSYQSNDRPDISILIKERAKSIINLLNNGDCLYRERLAAFEERNKSKFLSSSIETPLAVSQKDEKESDLYSVSSVPINMYQEAEETANSITESDLSDNNGWRVKEKRFKKIKSTLSSVNPEVEIVQTDRHIIIDGSNVAHE